MKSLLAFLLFVPAIAFSWVGPDLSKGVDVAFFTKLRLDYAKNPGTPLFPMWTLAPEVKEINQAYKAGEVDKVIELADGWLKKCPVDADTHLRVAMCFKEKGDLPSYTYHLGIFYGLLQSITSGGDGLTPKTAFTVISVQEEYSLIQEIGGRVKQQSLIDGPCDKMEITRNEGETALTLYFNVAIPMKAMDSQLKSGKE